MLTRFTVSIGLLFLVASCASNSAPRTPGSLDGEDWRCRNDLEVSCGEAGCSAEAGDAFTPMDIHIGGTGEISVCAYSGCWEGDAKTIEDGRFLMLIGHGLEHSTSEDPQDLVLTIDRQDGVGMLKVSSFALPILCKRSRT